MDIATSLPGTHPFLCSISPNFEPSIARVVLRQVTACTSVWLQPTTEADWLGLIELVTALRHSVEGGPKRSIPVFSFSFSLKRVITSHADELI